MLYSKPLYKPQNQGFSLVELLISISVFAVLLTIVLTTMTNSLQTQRRESLQLDAQQNLRIALQQISQDLRVASHFHVWHQPSSNCTPLDTVCSTNNEISIVTSNGNSTSIPLSGTSFVNTNVIPVCDSNIFSAGDVVTLLNRDLNNKNALLQDIVDLLVVQNVPSPSTIDLTLDCSNINSDDITMTSNTTIGGASAIAGINWQDAAYLFSNIFVNYSLQTDPLDNTRKVLYRRTGLGASGGASSGIVSFDVTNLTFSYGVPNNISASTAQLIFYDTLADAATAFGTTYTDDPQSLTANYIGLLVKAVRVSITGETTDGLKRGEAPKSFTYSETIDFTRAD